MHAILSASGAHRWLECTPSARLEAEFAETTSTYAQEGTLAHEVAANCALYWVGQISEAEYENTLNRLKKSEYFTHDMLLDCQAYAELIFKKWSALKERCADATVMIEARIEYSAWAPGGFGTADCLIFSDDELEVIDFKYGKGKKVNALNNPQMMLYALGAYNTFGMVYGIEHVTMTIFQPRLSDPQRSDEITASDLLDWGDNYVRPRAKLAWAGKGEFKPSNETCQFCKVKATCRARAKANAEVFDNAPDVMLLSPDEAGALLEKSADIKSWLADLEAFVKEALLNGGKVAGWKLVEGRSNRAFKDPKAVAKALKAAGLAPSQIYKPRELMALTNLEKLYGKAVIAETLEGLIVKPQGKPTLAPESDSRKEYVAAEAVVKAFEEASEHV